MKGHFTSVWHRKCACKFLCQRTLYADLCTHRAGARPPVACSSGTDGNLHGELHLGSSRVPICLHNLSTHTMGKSPQRLWLDRLSLPNKCHLEVHQTRTPKESNHKLQKGWVLEALNLQGLQEWPESEQKQARELLLKWEHLDLAHSGLDLGKTALIKHKIELMDWMPFKEHYQCIPPHMYNNVRAHIQEMMDIGAIYKLHSPWANAELLVWKKGQQSEVLYQPQETQQPHCEGCILSTLH